MNKSLENEIKEVFKDIKIDTEMNKQDVEITEKMKRLINKVEKSDKSYRLSLDDAESYLKISSLLFKDGQVKRAEDFAKKALKIDKSYEGFMLRGNTLYEYRDYKGALGYYNEALKYKQNKSTYLHKAKALRKRGMDERALESLEKAIKIEMDPDLLAMCGDILVDLDRIEEAEKFFSKAEETGGRTEYKEKKIHELLEEAENQSIPDKFDKILKLDKQCKEAWIGKAGKLWNLGDKNEAIECLEDANDILDDEDILNILEDYKENLLKEIECENCGGSGVCPSCEGTGDCLTCGGTGDCKYCEGTSFCSNCDGSGECPNCDGTGKTGLFSKCEVCGGDGVCIECGGHGMCEYCDGTGNCLECGGNGNCEDCQGSGECPECEGKGVIIDSDQV